MNLNQFKHFFFDLDGTLARTRQDVEDEMLDILKKLSANRSVGIISGSRAHFISKRMPKEKRGTIYIMGQNGNTTLDPEENLLWVNSLSSEEKEEIHNHISSLRKHTIIENVNLDNQIEDRDSQISYSFLGHDAPLTLKESWDPDRNKRRKILREVPFVSDKVDVYIAGTTCFDYNLKGFDKGLNIRRLMEEKGWDRDKAIYFGDALVPGGNDETVIGVIPHILVKDQNHTLELLKTLFR
jgi:HAD superfamily hydrolase (TIGR01484 family)